MFKLTLMKENAAAQGKSTLDKGQLKNSSQAGESVEGQALPVLICRPEPDNRGPEWQWHQMLSVLKARSGHCMESGRERHGQQRLAFTGPMLVMGKSW